MRSQNILLELRDITVTYSRWGQTIRALDNVTLSIPAGQWVMLVGHNGSGKSTLLSAISGNLRPDSGEIKIVEELLWNLSTQQVADKLFHVHQDPLLGTAPTLTLFENLFVADSAAHRENTSRKQLVEKYYALLKPLGLSGRLKQLARNLSGGERQLLALLVARLRPASLILLDEPLAALDPAKAELCLEQIKALNKEGKTIIQVTHEPSLAISGGNRTIVLRQGRIVYDEIGNRGNADSLRRVWAQDISGEQTL